MLEFEILTENPFYVLKDSNLITLGKRAKESDKTKYIMLPGNDIVNEEATKEIWMKQYNYFVKCFLAEHSTIENLTFRVIDSNCRGDVAAQIVRHTKGHPRFEVQSKRPDWNGGQERLPSDKEFKYFQSVWTPLSWMQMCRQRLCNKAMKATRDWVCSVLVQMRVSNDPFFKALEDCSIPQCEYRGNKCYEIKPCGMCK